MSGLYFCPAENTLLPLLSNSDVFKADCKHTNTHPETLQSSSGEDLYWWQSKAGVKKNFHHLLYMKGSVVSFLDIFFSHSTALLHHISIREVHIENVHNAFIRNAITQAKIPLYKGAGRREQKRDRDWCNSCFCTTYYITEPSWIRVQSAPICLTSNPV